MTQRPHSDILPNIELDAAVWKSINAAALWIHGQHELDALQDGTLRRIAGIVPHRIAMFDLLELDAHGAPTYTHPASTGMDGRFLTDYYERYAAMDYTTWSFDLHAVNVYRDLDLVDVTRRDTTPIYLEWMEPQGVYYGCTATLACDGTPLGTITLFREHAAGDFTDTELTALKEIALHVSLRLHDLYPHGINQAQAASDDSLQRVIDANDIQPREAEVLRLMLSGATNRHMAEELFISESTVKKHVNAIYRKLGVKNRMGLMAVMRTFDI